MINTWRIIVVLAAVGVALPSSTSLVPTVNASFCPQAQASQIAICPRPLDLPVKSWEGTINGFPAVLNITSVDSAGKVKGSIVGGDFCNGDTRCVINGTFDMRSGKVTFLNTGTSVEKRVLIGLQNFTGQESKTVLLDILRYTLAGTGTNIKGGIENKTASAFNWEFDTICLVIKPC
jgi:hypothetical protein